ncbi:MAG: hypothetical protein LUH02_06390 [Erysipelotrichaceae bacterium]|nr:hypothetical protein [Erysipelotrichaceae bacterium]
MSIYIMTFNTYSMIAAMENGQIVPKKLNAFIPYGSDVSYFKSSIKMTENDVVIGDKAKNSSNSIYIENLVREFEDEHKTYSLNGKIYTIKNIIEKYFSEIKKEIEHHSEEPIYTMIIIVPYKYRKKAKNMLIDIFNNIHFKYELVIEDDVRTGYLDYYNVNQIYVPIHDQFMVLDIEYDFIEARIFETDTLYKGHNILSPELIFKQICERIDAAFRLYPLFRRYFLKEMAIDKDYYALSKSDQEILDSGINELIKAFENRSTYRYPLYICLPDEFVEYEKTYTNHDFIYILSETGIISQISLVVAICMFVAKLRKIDKILYMGPTSTMYGVQERINQYYNINQKIIDNTKKMFSADTIRELSIYIFKD